MPVRSTAAMATSSPTGAPSLRANAPASTFTRTMGLGCPILENAVTPSASGTPALGSNPFSASSAVAGAPAPAAGRTRCRRRRKILPLRDHPESLTPDLDQDGARGVGPCRHRTLDSDHVIRLALAKDLGNRQLRVVPPHHGAASRPIRKDTQVLAVAQRVAHAGLQRLPTQTPASGSSSMPVSAARVDETLWIDGVHGQVRTVDCREHDARAHP